MSKRLILAVVLADIFGERNGKRGVLAREWHTYYTVRAMGPDGTGRGKTMARRKERTLEELREKAYQAWEDHKADVVTNEAYRTEAEKHGPVCENCGQWQRTGRNGYLDCLNDCAQRGFAFKSKLQVKTRSGWMTVCESTFNSWKGGPGTWRILKNEKGSAGIAKLIVLGIIAAIWFMMAANYTTPSVASDLAAHKAQIEQMLEVK